MTKAKEGTEWLEALEDERAGDNEPITVELLNKEDEPYMNEDGTPCTVDVLGEYSDAVRKHDRRNTNRVLKRGFRTQKIDADELRDQTAERLAVATTGWNLTLRGTPVEFTPENAKQLYRFDWIADQIAEAMRSRVGFSGASSNS